MRYLAYISMGSNIGNLAVNCKLGISYLEKIQNTKVEKVSSFYKTEPVEIVSDNHFINCVILLKTSLGPHTLLEKLLEIEYTMGRVRNSANKDRVIDLDLLLFGDKIINSSKLVVPHPGMHKRSFVLTPLSELDPELYHPVLKKDVVSLLSEIYDQNVQKIE